MQRRRVKNSIRGFKGDCLFRNFRRTTQRHRALSRTRVKTKAVWDMLSESGYSVWICGSMNSRYDRPLNGYLLPGPGSPPVPPSGNSRPDLHANRKLLLYQLVGRMRTKCGSGKKLFPMICGRNLRTTAGRDLSRH
jgi:hypothetical protein